MKKRVISWLLTVVMVVSLLPTSVLADTLAADQEQQTRQEQIAPADTENTVPAEDEETQEQQEPAEEVPVSRSARSGGAALALVLTSIGVPALAFALGMFIPMELNAPLVVGGLVAWFVSNRSKDEALNKARFDRGTLIASGFIAGGALMGVVSAVLKFVGVDWFLSGWASSNAAEWTGLAMYLVLIGYFAWHTLRAKKEE